MRFPWKTAACTALVLLCFFWRSRTPKEVDPLPESRVLQTIVIDAAAYKIADDGNIYRTNPRSGRWSYVETAFDPNVVARSYVREGATIFRCDPNRSSERYPVTRRFSEGFEDVPDGTPGLRRLIGAERMWTELTLQSPQTPKVSDYVALRRKILSGEADFLDASVAPSTERAHSGKASLKCICPAKTSSMICAKASLSNSLVYFEEGDDVWYQAWYYVAGDVRPFTLVDLEADLVHNAPGIRVMLYDEGEMGVELKAADKPQYRQKGDAKVKFPTDRWVQATWHLHLDSGANGRVRLWQDDRLIVDATGQTHPFRTAVYNSLEVGISAHSFGDRPATLYVDDVLLTTTPLRKD